MTDKMPDEIWAIDDSGCDCPNIWADEQHWQDEYCTKYHHHRIVEAKDAEIAQLKADAKSAEDDFEAMYQMVKSRNAEIERLRERERVLRERLTEYTYNGLKFVMDGNRKAAEECKNEILKAAYNGLANAYEEVYGVLNEILQQTLQTQKGS